MTVQTLEELFKKWESVWHEARFDLVPECVGTTYARHDEQGDRLVSRDDYLAELVKIRAARPDIRVWVHEHEFNGDRAWFRFAFKWTDTETGKPCSRAGMQLYRIEAGKLAETWVSLMPPGSTWPDAPQADWTTKKPVGG
jgi:hypothetical protein